MQPLLEQHREAQEKRQVLEQACTLLQTCVLWVFPSFELIGSVLGKLQVQQVDAILMASDDMCVMMASRPSH